MKGALMKMRTLHGASSPTGSRCSNILQGFEALRTAPPKLQGKIRASMDAGIAEIAMLQSGVAAHRAQVRRPQVEASAVASQNDNSGSAQS